MTTNDHLYKSKTLPIYTAWLAIFHNPELLNFVDTVYEFCERHYETGGDIVVEGWTPAEILKEFKTLDDVKLYIRTVLEEALNCRLGNDDDPELIRYHNFPS